MGPPVVYIEKGPFLIIILASIETFKRECLGYIFGYKPTNKRNSFVITNAIAIQLAQKRKNSEVEQSKLSARNIDGCCEKYPTLFRGIGIFHSHPEWGKHKGSADLSKRDIKAMVKEDIPISIIMAISSINKDRVLWQSSSDGGIKGSLGKYKFHIKVHRIVKNGDGKSVPQALVVRAPGAIKLLNRALVGYS